MLKNKSSRATLLAAVILLLAICVQLVDEELLGYGNTLFLSLIVLQLLVLAVPAIFYIKMSGSGFTDKLRLHLIKPSYIWFAVTTTLSLIFGSSVIRLTMSYMGETDSLFGEYSDILSSAIGDPEEVIYILLAFAIIPSVCEEMIYRGIIMSEFSDYGYAAIAVVPAIYCAFLRFDCGTLLLFIFSGVVYALSVKITGSLLSSIIIHTVFNIFNLFFEKYILRIITQNEYAVLCSFVLITLTLVSFILMFSETERITYNSALSKGTMKEKEIKSKVMSDNDEENSFSEKLQNMSKDFLDKLKLFASAFYSPFSAASLLFFIIGCIIR